MLDNLTDEILTIPQVAKYLQVSRNKAYLLVRNGKLPCFKIERNVRVRKSDLCKWIDEQVKTAELLQ